MAKTPSTSRSQGRVGRLSGAASSVVPASPEDRFARIFAALGESTRLRIMQMLPREPICEQMYNVVELAEELGLTQPTVSHHLKILREAGVVECRRACNSLYFYVNQPVVKEWLVETKRRFGCAE